MIDMKLPEGNVTVDPASGIATIDAAPNRLPIVYKALNEQIHRLIESGNKHIRLLNVVGQRFIAAALTGKDVRIEIHGTPGNDLGIFMDGPTLEVHGNVEDQAGNTMNDGKIIIHGSARDVAGLSARGGSIYVRGDGGYRVGVHMKQYQAKRPVMVFGGFVRDFFGEYMSGGLLVALGLDIKADGSFTVPEGVLVARSSLATGIHGGKIFLARPASSIPQEILGKGAKVVNIEADDMADLEPVLEEFCKLFHVDAGKILAMPFCKVIPVSKRPFASNYCSKPL